MVLLQPKIQPKNSLSLATVLLVAFTLIKVLAEEFDIKTPESQKREILETIKQIGSDNFKIRESATQKLWKFGRIAEPLLRDALKNGGPELRYRGTKILEEFELGLYPDTPEDIAKLINDYRSGVGVKKEAAIIKMAELGSEALQATYRHSRQFLRGVTDFDDEGNYAWKRGAYAASAYQFSKKAAPKHNIR